MKSLTLPRNFSSVLKVVLPPSPFSTDITALLVSAASLETKVPSNPLLERKSNASDILRMPSLSTWPVPLSSYSSKK
ncbi:hypothetical protein ACKS0A_02664 [Histoplasma ohiense]